MTDSREDLARQLLHSTAVERLDPTRGTFEQLTAAGARRRSHRRLMSASAMAAVVVFVVGLVVVVTHDPNRDSRLQPGGKMDNFLAESLKGHLRVAATVPLHLSAATNLVGTEAPDGAFFFAPQSKRDTYGDVTPGTSGTNVVRVIDGTSAPAIAEHAPGPVLGLGADAIDLYVATPTHVIRYSRSTGAEVRTWPLLSRPVNQAQIVLAGRWMYVATGFQCDFCGANTNTLLAINLVTGTRRALSTKIGPTAIAGDEHHVFYTGFVGGLNRRAPTGGQVRSQLPRANYPEILGTFGGRLAVLIPWAKTRHPSAVMKVFDPGLHLLAQWQPADSDGLFELVPSATGEAFYSGAECPQAADGASCGPKLGHTVSRLDIANGRRSRPVQIPHIAFLFGPAPAAVTVSGGSYQLVRIR